MKVPRQQEHAADKQKLQEVVNTLQEKLHFASLGKIHEAFISTSRMWRQGFDSM